MIRRIILINALTWVVLVFFFVVYPAGRTLLDLGDPALQGPGIPKAGWRLFRNVTPRYANWARERVAQGQAESLSINDISGTEWPLFGSAFYLWAIENLQAAWEAGDHTGGFEPKVYAREAIIAASELIVDPKHASWVKRHWGDDYLRRENVFYRMLVIAVLTSREKLLKSGAHLELLREQVESLARELDASKSGLLDDYPGECYPGDVLCALMCIQRADAILGTDHSAMLKRAQRSFIGAALTRHHLPPYAANSKTGTPISGARGCANSYLCLTAPELWPDQAKRWFELYDRFFWQERITAVGYREYPSEVPGSDWTFDVDAGPVIAGHGVAASAFGLGAARKNGRFDRAYPLAAEMMVVAGELPNGILAVPRLLSNLGHAPMLGEAAILWQLSIQPQQGFAVKTGGGIPTFVYVVLASAFLIGLWRIWESVRIIRQAWRSPPEIPAPGRQVVVWLCCMVATIIAFAMGHVLVALLLLMVALFLPVKRRKKKADEFADWPEAKARQAASADGTMPRGQS